MSSLRLNIINIKHNHNIKHNQKTNYEHNSSPYTKKYKKVKSVNHLSKQHENKKKYKVQFTQATISVSRTAKSIKQNNFIS